MDEPTIAQALRYAEELRDLYAEERAQRRRAEEALARLQEVYAATVRALSLALELRDDQTGSHATRVADLALRLSEEVAPALAAERDLEYGFLLHDVGKIGIPDAILRKPGPLDETEREIMREHTELGERILDGMPGLGELARDVVAAHHERWDGGGYPRGLAGDSIPLAARIFALADAWDAMTNDRPYRKALPPDHAVREIRTGAGSHFDPEIAESFLALTPNGGGR